MDTFLAALSALADPLRWRILAMLRHHPDTCVCDLREVFDVPQSTLSSHLRILREAGLVTTRKRGLWVHYSPAPHIAAWLGRVASGPLTAGDALRAQLEEDLRRATASAACCEATGKPASEALATTARP